MRALTQLCRTVYNTLQQDLQHSYHDYVILISINVKLYRRAKYLEHCCGMMPRKPLGCCSTNQIHNPKLDIEASTLPGGVWSIYNWDLYMAAHWLRSQIQEPAGKEERRAGPRAFPGMLRAQHPVAGSARSQLWHRPSQHSLKSLLDMPSQNHCETSKKSTKQSLLHNKRTPEHSSKKYESFSIPFSCLVLFKYFPQPMALSHNFGVKRTPLLKSIPKSPTE